MEATLSVNKTVFLTRVEECWNKPYVKKRSHVYDTRSVILKGIITEIKGDEFKAKLVDNNGFEKDGEEFVFHKGCLLSNQNYSDTNNLGKWKYSN